MISPLVTIAIPTRNRKDALTRAVRSVQAQTYDHIELVISDNASDDGTQDALHGFQLPRLIVVRQSENIGMIGNFNACLRAASGVFVLMLSDDDYLHPEAVSTLVKLFEDEVEVGVAWTPATIVDPKGKVQWVSRAGPRHETGVEFVMGSFREGRGPRFCGVMVRTADARNVGGYRPRHGPACDVGNWAQIALRYPRVSCSQVSLTNYTIQPQSVTNESALRTWKTSATNIADDLIEYVEANALTVDERRFRAACRALVGDLIIASLSQSTSSKRWIWLALMTVVREREYLVTWPTINRFLRNAWKLMPLIMRFRKS